MAFAPTVWGQHDHGADLPQPPVMPGDPQTASPPAPLEPISAQIEVFAAETELRGLTVSPDSVSFGGLVWIVAEPAGAGSARADSLVLPVWLEPAPQERQLAELDPPAGALVVPVRVYGIAPFTLTSGGAESALVTVSGGGTDGSLTAPVRQPRRPGWNALTLAALLLSAVVLAILVWWLWNRRKEPRAGPVDRVVAPAAWPEAAIGLEHLLSDLRATGDSRAFLDGLAALARAYAAGRFGIAGREMTGREIAAACDRLGYAREVGRGFSAVITAADNRRFDPSPVSESWCLDRTADLVASIDAVRIAEAGPSVAAAGSAWDELGRRLVTSGGEGG